MTFLLPFFKSAARAQISARVCDGVQAEEEEEEEEEEAASFVV